KNREIINQHLIDCLKHSSIKSMRRIMHIHQFTENKIQHMIPDRHSDFDSWLVIGCPRSRDIDVVVFVRESDHSNGQTKPLSIDAMIRLHKELEECGYDLTRELDINP